MLLLAWTAVDLTASQLCALDAVPAAAVTEQADAGEAQLPLAPDPAHVDDCFCCSHCVDVKLIQTELVSSRLSAPVRALDERAPLGAARPLFHPPQSV